VKINLAKLNHILLPSTKEGRDRFRRSLLGRLVSPLGWLYDALSDEGKVLAAASFLIGGFGLDVNVTEVHVLWGASFALLVASLSVTRAYRLREARVTAIAPRRVTVGDEMKFAVVVHNDGPRDLHAVRVSGPFLPWDGRYVGEAPRIPRIPAGESARVEVAARFAERGEHHLDAFRAALLVPLGLAQGRAVASAGSRFLVVPKIARVVRLRTPPGSRYQPGGVALASKTGESMDLLGVRPYRAGDPVRHLHARSSARLGAPVVREYQEEYFSRIGVVVDAAAPDARRLEAILSLAAGVVAHLSRGEALIDLLVVGDRVHDLTIGRHLGFLEQALDLLACVKAERRAVDPDLLLERLAPHLRRLSSVVVVAPAWDGGALAERIRGSGVGCTTLIVEGIAGVTQGDARAITVDAIERGEALSL
jgi:uncharacterized protein (DUF58 family)